MSTSPRNTSPTSSVAHLPVDTVDKQASCGGHGTNEMRLVIRTLEAEEIPCCACGVSALMYYGAARVRTHWEICVPPNMLELAETLLLDRHSSRYTRNSMAHQPDPHLRPCPHLKCIGINVSFILIPSHLVHIECQPSNFERSSNGIPYPTLPVLIQSFLDRNDRVSLQDAVDGSNVTEEWGVTNLDLHGYTDTDWAHERNAAISMGQTDGRPIFFGLVSEVPFKRKELWESAVRTKKGRLGWKTPETLFVTRFRLRNSSDPWLGHRECC
ncbi:hypothetical protein CRV24_010070 [Beauveria bassiana]|nr:hypothetical protein CRV24_010070 [Beauveria bassiana]